MIDFALDPELELLADTARRFAEAQLRPGERASESARSVPGEVAKAFREIGLAAVEVPEALGGAGLGALAGALVREELAAVDAGAAVALDPLGPALHALVELAPPELQREWIPPLLAGGGRATLVWNEDPVHVRLTGNGAARRARGEVPWVPAERADLLVLLDRDGATLVCDGIAASPLRGGGLRAAGAAALALEDAPVRARLEDPARAMRARARVRLHVAALLLGTLRASAELARSYARERVAFGRPIAHHQALAFLLVDMRTAVDQTRLLVHEAAWRLDRGADAAEAAAGAFAEAAEQAAFVTPNGVQVLGGHGFMQDYPAEKYMREARALALLAGGLDAAREEAGRALGAPPVALTLSER